MEWSGGEREVEAEGSEFFFDANRMLPVEFLPLLLFSFPLRFLDPHLVLGALWHQGFGDALGGRGHGKRMESNERKKKDG